MGQIVINTPDLWARILPRPDVNSHKYTRGHIVIYGAPKMTGASRLAASAAARIGAGLVSVLAPPETGNIYRSNLPAHIIVRDDLTYADERITARLLGRGGLPCPIKIESRKPYIIDADGLAALPEGLLGDHVILTPHEGEFAGLFPEIHSEKPAQALKAAQKRNCIIVLKGAETVIAHPDGRVVINHHASPYLASAGTGDVLAGMIAGLAGQGMEPFDAVCAAVWMHGEAGIVIGSGLVASDIPDILPTILRHFA